jgi:ABC-type multidrug transport system ATPase subunit
MQDDILEPNMTPLEILLFTAKLKLHLPLKEIEEKVEKIIVELNLYNCRNTKIGNNFVRGVSGGERKRTSIGVELISDPKIIFLDEPTTGLDSYNAYELISNLNQLAKIEEKIIIFTIHQPSSEIFNELEKVFILADGKTVFFGPMKNSINFFKENLKINYPENYNPFEFFIEMTNMDVLNNKQIKQIPAYNNLIGNLEEKGDEDKQNAFSDYISLLNKIFLGEKFFVTSEENKKSKNPSYVLIDKENNHKENYNYNYNYNENDIENENVEFASKEYIEEFIKEKGKTKGFFYEFNLLFGRNAILAIRNKKILFFKVFQNIITAVMICILFYNLTKDRTGIQDRIGFIFLNIVGVIFGATNATILSCKKIKEIFLIFYFFNFFLNFLVSDERKVFLREYTGKMYQIPSYFIARTCTEIPVFFISTNIYIGLLYQVLILNDTYSYKYFAYGKKNIKKIIKFIRNI